ncbi:Uncharacterized protein PECH_003338 [Penicillium ucsense]|uniref:NTF2 domain-containing protein n=1 Tax=Penicillium ucsense TaxID=2839758 RepID=A0A8J8VXG0_9EURO|nr:Uncharacterized protein PECM_003384 [Penicillium ucsense]KAF7729498.1 Uncharacterized protein PECH_003338 [Penicillium ucsense]
MSDMTQAPVNGNYGAQHGFPDAFNPAHAAMNTAANFQPAQSSTPTSATPSTSAEQQKSEITKDEVGWFFVEQFYTTMSRNPDKLHLFYSKRSQLVFGTEAESVPVAVGTKAINERIKSLDFQDCKVRVLNVDSQASFENILVSVVGEISNKSEPSRKFVQTFVLAEQPNGYYVLNDIFRYLVEENEAEEAVSEADTPAVTEAPAAKEEPAPAATEEAKVSEEAAPAITEVDEKLEKEVNGETEQSEETTPQANGAPADVSAEEPAKEPAQAPEPEVQQEEVVQTPEPTPVAEKETPAVKEAASTRAPAPAAAPAAPAAPVPAVPKTWASIASKVNAAKAAAAASAAAAPAAAAAPTTSTPAAAPAPAAATSKTAAPVSTESTASTPRAAATPAPAAEKDAAGAEAGWQTAGADHKKTQSRAAEDQVVLGYMKNVTEKVDAGLLKQTLARFGKLKYFDVNRPKNSAFVEFAEPSAYAAAVAANPHQVGTEQIVLEERRPRPNTFGNGYPAGRGRGGRGDRGGSQGRGGFQRDGRGGFAPRGGRGGNAAAKGRNGAPAA